ncbi:MULTISPECIES: sn-glycerol-3-phosphate ABC transporter ATP-binding protein UgpC [unclassified Ensifer]|uniref:ABC transporter ATP-binding protein n=1 Tax=unclassified Ensifer TaxID=2633371 RepID=UPI0008130ADC|nr:MULTISPECIES: sn-glycerol-3-phosphate ABC transporter ATP-binding protein UgpC [unclassified Ensifer]OCO99964.1 ABC transporter ATP-binding protein [Ensifer sp. LC13]OCP00099.1 ABC transporter ATP-binding protein [Ensifer sp. LC11]OCP04050.1 ABC transporter ATP-binding protein [Ensifer sp. LC14]OCP30987.1 ABC transporter ATP-binding protein [Ensifer sp. LC499]
MASVTFTNVSKKFGEFVAVTDFNLEVRDKEFLVLLGPSGCGKTTTMRMVAGLEEATSGDIFIDAERINGVLPKYRDVAMVFQSYALYPHLTVEENIGYPLKIRKVPTEERKRRIAEVARRVELETMLSRLPKELSGGQRQRVALARAIVRTPRVFLMDEPLSNLDAKLRTQMRAELKHLQHELQITTIYVTHDQIEAMTLAHRVAVMNKGVIEQLGTPREIYSDPRTLFVAGFIGSPPMNLIPGDAHDGVFTNAGFRAGGLGRATVSRAVLGVRPEDVHATGAGDPDVNLVAPIYSVELTGENTLVSLRLGAQLLTLRADKNFAGQIDQPIGIKVSPERLFLFDGETQHRVDF